jgi:hypothetical protein
MSLSCGGHSLVSIGTSKPSGDVEAIQATFPKREIAGNQKGDFALMTPMRNFRLGLATLCERMWLTTSGSKFLPSSRARAWGSRGVVARLLVAGRGRTDPAVGEDVPEPADAFRDSWAYSTKSENSSSNCSRKIIPDRSGGQTLVDAQREYKPHKVAESVSRSIAVWTNNSSG